MARLARVIIPGLPHHVTQRGNRREPIFFEDGDQEVYRDLLAEQVRRRGVAVWAYCPMPNHVHLILAPQDEAGLGLAVGEAHRRYTNFINARGRWTGHLFQSRFASGRGPPDRGGALCADEPGTRQAGLQARGLALV
jgi:putative transposase